MSDKKTVSIPPAARRISDQLRGIETPKGNQAKRLFVIMLLVFSALNTFRLFSISFGLLGLPIALAAIGIFDGGYIFWNNQVHKHAKGDRQKAIGELARAASLAGCAIMIVLDMALHSGQSYIPLDWQWVIFGWSAILRDVFGGAAMFLLVGMFLFHAASIEAFDKADVELQQEIQRRKAHHDEQARLLALQEAQNTLQSNLAAETVDELFARADEYKARVAQEVGKQITARAVADFAKSVTGGVMGAIEAEARDVEDVRAVNADPAPTVIKAAEAANFTTPAKPGAKRK
jgi:hypothetical protein